jgi:hypothetical protein
MEPSFQTFDSATSLLAKEPPVPFDFTFSAEAFKDYMRDDAVTTANHLPISKVS